MQISNANFPRTAIQILLTAVLFCLLLLHSHVICRAMDLEEKLPALAPPNASFDEPATNPYPDTGPTGLDKEKKGKGTSDPSQDQTKKARELNPTAAYNKGALAYHQKDFATALKFWTEASKNGIVGATWRIAHMYRLGLGTAVDHAKAFSYFEKVAEKHKYNVQSNRYTPLTIDALVWVATYYRNGLPDKKVKPDPQKALKIFRYAASHGQHPVAQYHLGDMYVTGNGVKANGARGMRWHNLAAKKDYAPSQAALGELYWQGKVVELNKPRAMMYFFLAIQSGRPSEKDKFRERLSMLQATATQPEIDRAQSLLNDWVARKKSKQN